MHNGAIGGIDKFYELHKNHRAVQRGVDKASKRVYNIMVWILRKDP